MPLPARGASFAAHALWLSALLACSGEAETSTAYDPGVGGGLGGAALKAGDGTGVGGTGTAGTVVEVGGAGEASMPPAGGMAGEGDGFAGTGGGAPAMPTPRLAHPGILNSAAELSAIRAHVMAKEEPWLSAFTSLQKSSYGSLQYQAKPFAVVECGSYNMPNVGCSQMVDDGMAAYAHALLWTVTRQQAHATLALRIIDAWATTYQKNLESNSPLVVGWATPWYANAAELLRYSDAGWSDAGIERFNRLLALWLPYVDKDEGPSNNWMQSRIEAHMAIAVFLDDAMELNMAVTRWSRWLPKYILDSGEGMETCRDLGHLGLGVRSLLYAAETAWQQGTDLFTPNQARLAKFIELHGSWMLGKAAVPSSVCEGKVVAAQGDAQGIAPPSGGGRMPLEILYVHLHDRLGQGLPNLRQMLQVGRPIGPGHWVTKLETLSHGQPL